MRLVSELIIFSWWLHNKSQGGWDAYMKHEYTLLSGKNPQGQSYQEKTDERLLLKWVWGEKPSHSIKANNFLTSWISISDVRSFSMLLGIMFWISVISVLSVDYAEMDTGKAQKFVLLLMGVLLDWW